MYLWWINAKDHVHPFGQASGDDFLTFASTTFLHEYGHFLGLSHSTGQDNIMRNGGGELRTTFTTCQSETMFESLMLRNVRKYAICEAGIDPEIVVNQDEIWKMNLRAYGDIRVKSGNTLEITCKVEMQPGTKIIVEEGAQLIINGAEITSCGLWRGITTRGGREDFDVKVYNDATIRNVNGAAISMFDQDGGWLLGDGNATVLIDDVDFYNCKRMLAMGSIVQKPNKSKVQNSRHQGGHSGITNWNCLNVQVNNNEFLGLTRDCIHGIDCSFSSISNNKFYREDTDIWMLESAPGSGSNIYNNVFNGHEIGMQLAGGVVGHYDIFENSFRSTNFDLFFDNSAEYNVYRNDFTGDFGIISASNGVSLSNVSRNSFIDNSIGVYPFGSNKGYVFVNNCFDTYVVDANIDDEIFTVQQDFEYPAGNCFTHQGVLGLTLDIAGDMNHFFYTAPDASSIDDCYDALNIANYTIINDGSVNEPGCGSDFWPTPPPRFNPCNVTENNDEIERNIRVLNERIEEVSNNNLLSEEQKARLIAIYKRCLERNLRMRGKMLVESGDYVGALEAYGQMEESELKQITIYGVYLLMQDYSNAENLLNGLNSESEVIQDFKTTQIINLLRLNSIHTFSPTELQVNTVRNIALKHHEYSAYAKGLLYLFTGEFYRTPLPESVGDLLENRSGKQNEKIEGSKISVFPNPVSETLTITGLDKEKGAYRVEIYDITGVRSLWIPYITDDKIDLSSLSTGIYICNIYNNHGTPSIHKIIKL